MPATTTVVVPQRSHSFVHYIFAVILTLIFLGGLCVLIAWLTIMPKRLDYSIENASVQKFNLTDDNHLSATFQFTIRAHNPNRRMSIYYESVEIFAKFKDQILAFDTVEPFYQPRVNVTRIEDKLVARNVAIPGSDAKDLRVQTKLGKIDLDVYVRARVLFKVGIWKSAHHTAKIECSPLTVSLSQQNKSQGTACDANL